MRTEKTQVVNGKWTFFYGTSMLDLKCVSRGDKAVDRNKAMAMNKARIEDFKRICDTREQQYLRPEQFSQ